MSTPLAPGQPPGPVLPPPDLPSPQVPPPSFMQAGEGLAAGAEASKWFQKFWRALLDALAEATALIVGTLLKLGGPIGASFARGIIKAEDEAGEEFAKLSAIAVEDLFGVKVDPGAFRGRGGRGGRQNASREIGGKVLGALFTALQADGGRPLEPSDQGARDYLTTVISLAMEGWLEGWIAEVATVGVIENFAELDDIMVQVLGLQRLSRRVMNPPVSILVEQPFEWLLNKRHRPKLLSANEAARQFVRGRWTMEQVREELSRQGLSDDRIEAVLNAQRRFLALDDIGFLLRVAKPGFTEPFWSRDQAIQYLKDAGFAQLEAELQVTVEEQKRIEPLRNQIASAVVGALAEGLLTEAQARGHLQAVGLAGRELEWTLLLAGFRKNLREKRLGLGQAQEAVKRGIWSLPQFRAYLASEDYRDADQTTLELLLLTDISEEQAAKAAREKREAEQRRQREQAKTRDLSLSQAEEAVKRGVIDMTRFRGILKAQGYSAENIDALTRLLEIEIEEEREREAERRARAERVPDKAPSFAQMEEAFRRGLIDRAQLERFLSTQGLDTQEIALVVQLVILDLEEDRADEREREELERLRKEEREAREAQQEQRRREAESRRIALEQKRERERTQRAAGRAARENQRAEARRAADARRAAERERREQLRREAARQRAAEREKKEAERRRIREEARKNQEERRRTQEEERERLRLERLARDVTIGQFEEAVKRGIRTMDEYISYLLKEQFDEDEIELLTRILVEEIEEAREKERERERTAREREERARQPRR